MDAELKELQRLFEEAQQATASVRLSERNVVELVTKLQKLGFLDTDLLHTVSGKEYITQERLRIEIEAEIKRLGRVSVVDLAARLGVDLFHCERQVQSITASNSELMLVQGEVISSNYWIRVAEEVNDTLQEAGQVSIVELARHFSVGAELLTGALVSQLGKLVHGKLEGGQLYTEAYVARIKAMVCGAVRALLVPTSLPTVWASIQTQLRQRDEGGTGGITGGGLFQTVLAELINEGAVKGTLRGGGTSWIPAVFAHSQHSSVEAFFSQNGYISYDAVRKLSISQPRQFLQEKYPEGILLETVFVHSSYIGLVDAAAEEAIDTGVWFDVLHSVPTNFTAQDTAMLLTHCLSMQKALKESRVKIIAETCVVTHAFIKTLQDRFEKELLASLENSSPVASVSYTQVGNDNKLENQFGAPKFLSSGNLQNYDTDDHGKLKDMHAFRVDSTGEKKMDAKRRKDNGAATARLDTTSEGVTAVKGGKAKKKAGKGRGGKNVQSDDSQLLLSKNTKGSSGQQSTVDDSVPSEETMVDKILDWFPDMMGAGADESESGGLAKSLSALLRPSISSLWSTAVRAKFGARMEARRHQVEIFLKKLDEVYVNFQLFTKALDLFEEEKLTEAILERHLLRTTASEIADLILRAHVLEQMVEEGDTSQSLDVLVKDVPLSMVERLTLAKGLQPQASSKAVAMVESLDGKTVQAFESALQAVLEESGRRLKKLDKKAEKVLLQSYSKDLAMQVEKEMDPVNLLPKVVALLFMKIHNRALQIPGRAIASAVAYLQKSIPDAAYKTLLEYQAATVALLLMLQTSSDDGDDCTSDRIHQKREFLLHHMADLKSTILLLGVAPNKIP